MDRTIERNTETLIAITRQLSYSMSGWVAVTLNIKDEQIKDNIDAELRETYQGRDPYTATGYADTTIQVERGADHETVAKRFAQDFPQTDRIAVVSANDTTDSGHGTLFQVTLADNGSRNEQYSTHPVKHIDSKGGYEGARGRDVTGYFEDEHGARSYATWEA